MAKVISREYTVQPTNGRNISAANFTEAKRVAQQIADETGRVQTIRLDTVTGPKRIIIGGSYRMTPGGKGYKTWLIRPRKTARVSNPSRPTGPLAKLISTRKLTPVQASELIRGQVLPAVGKQVVVSQSGKGATVLYNRAGSFYLAKYASLGSSVVGKSANPMTEFPTQRDFNRRSSGYIAVSDPHKLLSSLNRDPARKTPGAKKTSFYWPRSGKSYWIWAVEK